MVALDGWRLPQLDTFLGGILDNDLSAQLQDSGVPQHRIQSWRASVAASGRDKCSPPPIVGKERYIGQLLNGVGVYEQLEEICPWET